MKTTVITVGMAEVQVVKGPSAFAVKAIGGGVAIFALDPVANVAACAYFLLPEPLVGVPIDRPAKFGSTALPELLDMMERLGAQRSRVVSCMVGGAQFFKVGNEEAESSFDVGFRNVVLAESLLAELGIRIAHAEAGGNLARTATFSAAGGELVVRTQGGRDKVVANLRRQAVRA